MTHYQRLLNYIVPDFVHVLADGRIVRSGGKELALELEARGYEWVDAAAEALRVSEPYLRERRTPAGAGIAEGPELAGAAPAARRPTRFAAIGLPERRATRTGASRPSRRSRRRAGARRTAGRGVAPRAS